jgi:phosphoglycerate dehydrogenase-like enzyme
MMSLLPDGALVVDVSRSAVVHRLALEAESVSGNLRAFLDVTEPEPLADRNVTSGHPSVLITRGVGGHSDLVSATCVSIRRVAEPFDFLIVRENTEG